MIVKGAGSRAEASKNIPHNSISDERHAIVHGVIYWQGELNMAARKSKGDPNEARNHKRRYGPDSDGGTSGMADWSRANGEYLRDLIVNVTKHGGAVHFGCSRDGGAFAVRIYGDGAPYTVYRPPDIDLDDWLAEMVQAFE